MPGRNHQPPPTVAPIVEQCGGTQAVADALMVARGAVNNWVRKDQVPVWQIPPLVAFARSVGVALRPCHLFQDACRCAATRGKPPGRIPNKGTSR